MKKPFQLLCLAVALSLLGGCAATVPLKVASKTTKVGVKAAKTGVKAGAKAGSALIPNKSSDEQD